MTKKSRMTKPVLLLASLGVLGLVYTPIPTKNKPSREFICKVYARTTGEQRWRASEQRKMEILKTIRQIRKEIRVQANMYIVERQKIIQPTPKEQGIINRSNKLINNIFNTKTKDDGILYTAHT